MSITHTIATNYTTPAGQVSSTPVSVTDDAELAYDNLLAESTDRVVDMDFAVADVKSVFVLADKATTIKTNNSGAPDNTLALVANAPLVWYTGGAGSNFFTVDVTTLYVTCPANTTLKIRVLLHSSA